MAKKKAQSKGEAVPPPQKRTRKNKYGPQGKITPALELYCQMRAEGVPIRVAAIRIGRPPKQGWKIEYRPHILARVEQIRNEFAKAVTRRMVKKHLREVTIDRNDIIMGLADLAETAESERAAVAAYLGLADIFLLRAKNVRDLKEFHGWTTDELKTYALTGEQPERFRLLAGESESAPGAGAESLRTTKV